MGVLEFKNNVKYFEMGFIELSRDERNDVTIKNLKSGKTTTFHWFENNDYRLLLVFSLKQIQNNALVTASAFETYQKVLQNAILTSNHSFLLEEVKSRVLAIDKLGETIFSFSKSTNNFTRSNFWLFIFYSIGDNEYKKMYAQYLIDEQLVSPIERQKFIDYKFSLKNISSYKTKQIFFITEYNEENDLINKKIKNYLEKDGFKVILINEDHKVGNIDFAIKKYIIESQFVICNLDYFKNGYWNANVFFELGMAHALNKPTIMFLDEEKFPGGAKETSRELPFDISSHTCLKLEKGNDKKLINEIRSIVN